MNAPTLTTVTLSLALIGFIPVHADLYVWDGSDSTDWFDPDNWDLGAVPGAADQVLLPSSGVTYQPTLTGATTIATLTIQGNRLLTCAANRGHLTVTGDLTCQGTTKLNNTTLTCGGNLNFSGGTLTYDSSTIVMNGAGAHSLNLGAGKAVYAIRFDGPGTFYFADPDVTVFGGMIINDGAILAPTGTLTFYRCRLVHTNVLGTFHHNYGTVTWRGYNPGGSDVNGSETFFNLSIRSLLFGIAPGDTFVVEGTLTLGGGPLGDECGTIVSGIVNAKGPILVETGFKGASAGGTVGLLLIDGTNDQSFIVPDNVGLPCVTLSNAATTISFDPGANVTFVGRLSLYSGTFISTSGTLEFYRCRMVHAEGKFFHNNGTVWLKGYNPGAVCAVESERVGKRRLWSIN